MTKPRSKRPVMDQRAKLLDIVREWTERLREAGPPITHHLLIQVHAPHPIDHDQVPILLDRLVRDIAQRYGSTLSAAEVEEMQELCRLLHRALAERPSARPLGFRDPVVRDMARDRR